MDLPNIPASEVKRAQESGWMLLSGFLQPDIGECLRRDLLNLSAAPDKYPNCMYFYETDGSGKRRLNRVERIWECLPALHETGIAQLLEDCAATYLEGPITLFKDKLNIRYANSSGYAPHQDSAAGWDKFASRFVSFGLFLGRSDSYHGGFEIVSAAHNSGRFANVNGRMSDADFEAMSPFAVTGDVGDILVIDSETPHRTLHNRAEKDALHLLFTFAPAAVGEARFDYYQGKEKSFSGSRSGNEFDFRVFTF